MIINIIGGNGVMGSVHGKIFEKNGHKVIISGRNSNPSMEEAAKKSDLTIISVPIDVTIDIIKKIAPHCKAIMDFTSLKKEEVEKMLEYSPENCEVCGLHPLYGEVLSISDKTVVVCKTLRTGKLCNEVINCLEKEGAKIVELSPVEHDKKVVSINQALRLKLMSTFAKTIMQSGMSVKDFYEISSPPTKIIIELLARQVNEKNDSMYDSMMKDDNFSEEIENIFLSNFENIRGDYKHLSEEIRNSFGPEFLKELQDKVSKKIE